MLSSPVEYHVFAIQLV